jgi:hypothetical protein
MDREKKYQEALETHKHYDTVSLAICTGIIAVVGACFGVYSNFKIPEFGALIFLAGAVIVWYLFRLYQNCATSALIARNVSAALEVDDLPYGVSYVLVHINEADHSELKDRFFPVRGKGLGIGWRTTRRLTIILICFLLLAAGMAFLGN